MRVVLYDDETMEPLTVLSLPSWMAPRLQNGDRLKVPVITPVRLRGDDELSPGYELMKTVTLWFEKLTRKGETHWLCFTRDSENALSLRSVFLPGQWPAVHLEYQRGVGEGIVRALGAMLR